MQKTNKKNVILGVRYGHDSSASILLDGEIVADVQEERFTRQKNDSSFPINAIEYCLQTAGVSSEDIDVLAVAGLVLQDQFRVFFDIPEELLPKTDKTRSIRDMMPGRKKPAPSGPVLPLYQKRFKLSDKCKIELVEHHLAHAASVAYTSGLPISEKALVVTMDGSGDGVSCAVWTFKDNKIKNLVKYGRESSLGYFYSCATEAMMWRHGSDEWKLMGLAPYGKIRPGVLDGLHPVFEDGKLLKGYNYGKFGRWNDHGANHYHSDEAKKFLPIIEDLGKEDFAAEVQRVSEEEGLKFILPWLEKENTRKLFCAGGFFLNVKFNQSLWYSGKLDTQWVYPNCGDSGLALGSALYVFYQSNPQKQHKRIKSLYSGSEFNNEEIRKILDDRFLDYEYVQDPSDIAAKYLAKNYAIGWFQGRMEIGPRALGNRSILMSPLRSENKDIINAKITYREMFRPFTPSILYEVYDDYFVKAREEDFMVSTFEVKECKKERIPAVVHIDGTARPNMVRKEVNPRYHSLIKKFGEITGESVVLNTSFNIKGEPIVRTPREAIKCFYDTGLDVLIMGNFVLKKKNVE